jgi:hypothetical protein
MMRLSARGIIESLVRVRSEVIPLRLQQIRG